MGLVMSQYLATTVTSKVILLLLLLDRPPCTDGMHIVGRWCYTPYTEAKETLDSVTY